MKTLQRTLTIVKPDAVAKNAVGDIIEQFEKQGFRILAMKMLEISKYQAEQFYAVHASRPFYGSLTDFMSSGPVVALALEKENAIADLRKLMGATNPANAEEGTIEHRAQRHSRLRCRRYGALRVEFLLRGIRAGEVTALCGRERSGSPQPSSFRQAPSKL
jgi:nucleoside-diphosphate kinase